MPHKLKILGHIELSVLAYSGRVSATELDEVWQLLEVTPSYSPYFDDITLLAPDADYSDIAPEVALAQSQKFVEAFRAKALERPKRSAFVCSTNMHVAMSRMFGAFVYSQAIPNLDVRDFMSVEEAIAWVEPARQGRKIDRAEIARVIDQMGADWCLKSSAAA